MAPGIDALPECPEVDRVYGCVLVEGHYFADETGEHVAVRAERDLPGKRDGKRVWHLKDHFKFAPMSQYEANRMADEIALKIDDLERLWHSQRLRGRTAGASSKPKKRTTS